jgi:DNA-3-methyladenine glycosylase II
MPKPQVISKQLVSKAVKHFKTKDKILGPLLDKHARCTLFEREYRPFHTLTASIISQQLSSKAADTIEKRVALLVSYPFQAEDFLKVSQEDLRSAGLSQAKARYIKELARRVYSGELDLEVLPEAENEIVISTLVDLPGIGRWTAEMFLIFALKRPNVMSLGDAGLQRAAKLLYGHTIKSDTVLQNVSVLWEPYCSIASWYLWRHLDDPV